MRRVRAIVARCRGFLLLQSDTRALDVESRDEIQFHLEQQIAENIRRGMSPDEARRRALITAGGLTRAAELVRERRSIPWAEHVLLDVRYALRSLRGAPGYTTAALLTLALGIGVSTGMFAIVQAVVLRPLPYPDADKIVALSVSNSQGDMGVVDDRDYFAWARNAKSFKAMAVYGGGSVVLDAASGPRNVKMRAVTGKYFDVMGVPPRLGRQFTAEELQRGAAPVVVISDRLWRTEFGADPGVIGKFTRIDGSNARIVGVMPRGFTPEDGPQIFKPDVMREATPGMIFYFPVLARLKPGATLASAMSELTAITRHANGGRDQPGSAVAPVIVTLHDSLYGSATKPLVLLMAAVGVLLLIACANIANLAMARSVRRQREFALRRALGATARRLSAYVLVESLILSSAGAALGTLMAAASIKWAVRISPATISRVEGIHVNAQVLVFAAGAAVFTAITFGLIPALRSGRGDLNRSLAAGGPRAASSSRERSARRVLVVAELATALVLLVGAALVARTFWRVSAIDPGFNPHGLQVARVRLPIDKYSQGAAADEFYRDLMQRVSTTPVISQAALADVEPFQGAAASVLPKDSAGTHIPGTYLLSVGGGYFKTLGVGLIAGREFASSDVAGAEPVAVINASLANYMFPEGDAVGHTTDLDGPGRLIVGVVGDVRQVKGLEHAPDPIMYEPVAQGGTGPWMVLLFRPRGTVEAARSAITTAVQSINPALAPPAYTTMDEQFEQQVAPRKFMFVLLATFAALAALLAVIGLYGVLSYLVAEQTREMGIRAALGADRTRVTRDVMAHGLSLTLTGALLGVGAALLAVKLVSSLLYGIEPRDPVTLAIAAALLVLVSLVACYVPARRASRIDPILALRTE
jgi:predicted permease